MDVATEFSGDINSAGRITNNVDLGFLPPALTGQCRSLIESYHEVHGYTCLPDVLWKSRLGPLIESHPEFRQLLRKASTTRSAKKSNQGFVGIATRILALEILVTSFAGWSAIYPEAAARAQMILKHGTQSRQMPLLEFYLYPPKHISLAAVATLAPPPYTLASEAGAYRGSRSGFSGEKFALGDVSPIRETIGQGPYEIAGRAPT
jgi:hypothetical protein